MPDSAQALLGHFVDGRFPLRKLLGVSSNSAVFLTEIAADRPSDPATDVAIKLIPEDLETSDQQLERWEAVSALSHPGLLKLLHFGRCTVDGSHCLYVVTELAKENLGELLPQRALMPDETTGMLGPVLSTLDFLHENGLVHAGLKPSNILAIGDNIKLSPDRILRAGESAKSRPLAAPYAPPESLWFPASDIWSLGISLYETLTQYLPNHDSAGRYVLPQLPATFSEIVRAALVEDPAQRITLDEIRSLLDPAFVPRRKTAPVRAPEIAAQPAPAMPEAPVAVSQPLAAAAVAPAPARAPQSATLPQRDPLSVPLSPLSPKGVEQQTPARIPVASLPNVNATIAAARRPATPRATGGSFKFFLMGAVGTLLVAALILPRLLRNSADSASSSSSTVSSRTAKSAEAIGTSSSANNPAAPARTSAALPKAPATSIPPAAASEPPSSKTYSSVSSRTASLPNASVAPARSAASFDSAAPRVVHQAFPDVSRKALNTIRGTVRINVRVQLSADGSVSSTEVEPPVVSQFFSSLALKAAPQWRFAPSSGSTALIRFVFTNSGTSASVAP